MTVNWPLQGNCVTVPLVCVYVKFTDKVYGPEFA